MKTKRKMVRVYMLISRDKYQLPLMVSDDMVVCEEALARIMENGRRNKADEH